MPIIFSNDDIGITAASLLLCSGRQVVIPTETVYGLAANALDYDAVAEIFRIKGRPNTNPLIVHVHSKRQAATLGDFNKRAELLADTFWPGPLTIVVEASPAIATNVTANGTTVGLRMPNHLVTLRLLEHCGLPLAAPSANTSEGISPTTAANAARSLGELSPPILDGGSCFIGIESTVVDVTQSVVRILRPGAITREQIAEVLGEPVELGQSDDVLRSPGQMIRHYAPQTTTILTPGADAAITTGKRSALLCYTGVPVDAEQYASVVCLPKDATGYAAGLYAALHELDQCGADVIFVETPPTSPEWVAVNDRLSRATAQQKPE